MRKMGILISGLLIIAILLVLTGCSDSMKQNSYNQISMQEAVERMDEQENYILLDVRTEEEYISGHIPGAICIPNETIGTEDIPELPDKEQVIFVYCRSGNRSKQAASKLSAQGYTNVYEIGGIINWQGETVSGNK